jgi:hypothetical protein
LVGRSRLCELAARKERLSGRREQHGKQGDGASHDSFMYSRKGRRPSGSKAGEL